jgi:hypothetical protein
MTKSWCDEGCGGPQVPRKIADAQRRQHREGRSWGRQGFSDATEPKAREAA